MFWFLCTAPGFLDRQSQHTQAAVPPPRTRALDPVAASSSPGGRANPSPGFTLTRLIDLWRCKLHCPQQILVGCLRALQPPKYAYPYHSPSRGLRLPPHRETLIKYRYYDCPIDRGCVETVTVSPKFQVVIPKKIRDRLGLLPGQKIQAIAYGGRIELIPVRPARQMRGFLKGIDTNIEREADRD